MKAARIHEYGKPVVLEDVPVHGLLDALALLGGERLGVREVETELVRADRRAGLAHVVPEHLLERLVEQVRSRVVRHRREAHTPRHARADAITALVGVQPKLTQEPPRSWRSASATFFPALARACARGMPACPPPMMRMSQEFKV